MKTLLKFLFAATCISLLITCQKPIVPIEDQSDVSLKKAMVYPVNTVLNFTGTMEYKYVQVIGNNELIKQTFPVDPATITILGDQKIDFFDVEHQPLFDRAGHMYGKMTPSGVVTLEVPAPVGTLPDGTPIFLPDYAKAHLGATLLVGEGVSKGTLVYHGKFDGSKLVIVTNFEVKCPVEAPSNDVFDTPVEGPIQASWTLDLTLVQP
jgi:hypothetical protein